MTQVLLIAARELRERKNVFIAAAVAGVLAVVVPLLPAVAAAGRTEVTALAALVSAVMFAIGLAFALGGTMIGRELTTRRMSFYFSKPIPASAIWFGKLMGALLTIVFSYAIVVAPAVVAARPAWSSTQGGEAFKVFAYLVGWSLFILLVIHAASTMIRSRSAFLALDLVLLAAAAACASVILRPVYMVNAFRTLNWLIVGTALFIVATLIAGGVWHLSRGRTDVLRNHRELSKFVWPAIALFLMVAAALMMWLRSPAPMDLQSFEAEARGGSLYLRGTRAMDYPTAMVIDGRSGKWMHVPPFQTIFSRDGRYAVTLGRESGRLGIMSMALLSVDVDGKQVKDTGLTASPMARKVLSDDGKRIAIVDRGTISVHDIATGDLLGSAKIPRAPWPTEMSAFFVTPDRLRIYDAPWAPQRQFDRLELTAYEFDLGTRKLELMGRISTSTDGSFFTVSADGSRVVLSERLRQDPQPSVWATSVLDGGSLKLLYRVEPSLVGARLLSDGTTAGFRGPRTLFVHGQDGQLIRKIDLPARVPRGSFFGEIKPGLVVVAGGPWSEPSEDGWTTFVVDLRNGTVVRTEPDSVPVDSSAWHRFDPRQNAPNDSNWVLRSRGSIFRWNPSTGEKTLVARRKTEVPFCVWNPFEKQLNIPFVP